MCSYTANKLHNISMRTVSKLFSQPNFFHDRLSSFLSRSGCNSYTKAVIIMTMITMTVMTAIMTLLMMTMYSPKRNSALGKIAQLFDFRVIIRKTIQYEHFVSF